MFDEVKAYEVQAYKKCAKFLGYPVVITDREFTRSVLLARMHTQIGMESKGIEAVLRRMIGPYGVLKDVLRGSVSISDFFRPLTQLDVDEVRRKILEITEKVSVMLCVIFL